MRGRGDVVVLGLHPAHVIAHATTGEERFMPRLPQSPDDPGSLRAIPYDFADL